jgi:hypothetical protein
MTQREDRYITNENYPGKVFDKVNRCWIDEKRRDGPAKGIGQNDPARGASMNDPPPHPGEGARAPEAVTRRASEIEPEIIHWVWKGFLARGKLHILGGVPEAGKTTIALSYAAIVSSGACWPDGTRAAVGNVLIWTSEDDAADTLIPRLMRMDADLTRIHFVEQTRPAGMKPRSFNHATDLPALVERAKAIGDVVLFIIDSVVSAVPPTKNSHNRGAYGLCG